MFSIHVCSFLRSFSLLFTPLVLVLAIAIATAIDGVLSVMSCQLGVSSFKAILFICEVEMGMEMGMDGWRDGRLDGWIDGWSNR